MKERIRERALALGFDACRFAAADPPSTAPLLDRWLADGRHGDMAWMARNAARRKDPALVLPGVRSVIALAAAYPILTAPPPPGVASGRVARYACAADYHDALGPRLKSLSDWVDTCSPDPSRSLWYVDTGPVLEREFAQRAGLGFVGKHTNLIHRHHGNWVLLAEILTTRELEPDLPEKNRCGACTRCLGACPTQAITAPFQLDARRCISYLTIECRGPIPEPLRAAVGDRVFGCDDCLAVCPWNRFARDGRAIMRQAQRPELAWLDLLGLLDLDDAAFRQRFAGTPIERVRRRGLQRNACVALGNVGNATALPALDRARQSADPLVAEHAAWAIQRIETRA